MQNRELLKELGRLIDRALIHARKFDCEPTSYILSLARLDVSEKLDASETNELNKPQD